MVLGVYCYLVSLFSLFLKVFLFVVSHSLLEFKSNVVYMLVVQ
jgi:hypothetical protein